MVQDIFLNSAEEVDTFSWRSSSGVRGLNAHSILVGITYLGIEHNLYFEKISIPGRNRECYRKVEYFVIQQEI